MLYTCNCCNSKYQGDDAQFYMCKHCGHQWVPVDSELNLQYYSELSGRNSMPVEYIKKKLHDRVYFVLPFLKKGSRVLDIGCAEGDLGKILKDKIDINYTGVELSNDAVVAKKVLDKVIREPNVFLGEQKFDLIISFHVLEHIVDPFINVINWHRMLSNDGHIIVEVPNQSGHPFIGFDNNPEHIHQFSVASLASLLQRASFNVKSISTDCFESPAYCDSIRLIAEKTLKKSDKEKAMLAAIFTAIQGKFCIYGLGGDFYNYIYPLLAHLPVSGIYDSEKDLHGKEVGEYYVEAIDNYSYEGQLFLICSIRFQDEIKETLYKLGVPESNLFYLSDILMVNHVET